MPLKMRPDVRDEIRRLMSEVPRRETPSQIAARFGLARSTVYRIQWGGQKAVGSRSVD